MPSHSTDGALLTELAHVLARVQGQLEEATQELADPAGLTAARWQVLRAVNRAPAPASQIARALGLTRQAVQQTADALEANGLIRFRANPHHKRAKLIEATALGRQRLAAVQARQVAWANRLARRLGREFLDASIEGVRALGAELERERARRVARKG